jgi:hypothetical protein
LAVTTSWVWGCTARFDLPDGGIDALVSCEPTCIDEVSLGVLCNDGSQRFLRFCPLGCSSVDGCRDVDAGLPLDAAQPCGGSGEPCCATDGQGRFVTPFCEESGVVCVRGSCLVCGRLGQPCCEDVVRCSEGSCIGLSPGTCAD